MGAGADLVARIAGEMAAHGLEPDAKESVLLALAEGLADRLADLENCIERDGLCTVLKSGRVVSNPVVVESRMTRTSLATVLGKISMTEGPAKDVARQAGCAEEMATAQRRQGPAQWLGASVPPPGCTYPAPTGACWPTSAPGRRHRTRGCTS